MAMLTLWQLSRYFRIYSCSDYSTMTLYHFSKRCAEPFSEAASGHTTFEITQFGICVRNVCSLPRESPVSAHLRPYSAPTPRHAKRRLSAETVLAALGAQSQRALQTALPRSVCGAGDVWCVRARHPNEQIEHNGCSRASV